MSVPEPMQAGYTLEEWRTWEGRWELINGVAYDMTPAPSFDHQRLSSNLNISIGLALRDALNKVGGDCQVLAAPLDVYLDASVVQPDLVILCDPAKISKRGIEGAPDLVIEILSPATASKDVTRKWWLYEAAGVLEYLIVDPDEKVGRLLRLARGLYVEAARVEWGGFLPLLSGRLSVTLG